MAPRKRKVRKKSVFAKKGDPFTRTGRSAKKKVEKVIGLIPTGIRRVKAKKGVKKGIKRGKKSKFKLL